MQIKKIIHIVFVLMSLVGFAQTQPQVSAILDTNKILIGDQINFTLKAISDKDTKIIWPLYFDTIVGNVEIINTSKKDTLLQNNMQTISQTYTITSFDSGYYAIKPTIFKYITNKDTSVLLTKPLLLNVQPIAVDTTISKLKDIKQPLKAPFSLLEIWEYLAIGAGIIILGLIIFFLIKKLKNKPLEKVFTKPKIKVPAHITALNELKKLEQKKLWQKGHFKQYYTELTDIIRIYISETYFISAMEFTSDEILYHLEKSKINKENHNVLSQIFSIADLVKFAKYEPIANENELRLQYAYTFVNNTKPKEEVKQELENNNKKNNADVE